MDLGGDRGERCTADAGNGAAVDLRLWGKYGSLPWAYPLACHLVDTGAAVEVLWRSTVPESARLAVARELGASVEDAGRLVAFWAALHDIGKITPGFQMQVPKAFAALQGSYTTVGASGRFRHEEASQRFLHRVLAELGYGHGLLGNASAARVAQLLGGHHGCFYGVQPRHADPRVPCPELGGNEWERARRSVLREVSAVFGPPAAPRAVTVLGGAVACGLVVLADWLVSQEDFLLDQLRDVPAEARELDLREHRDRSAGRVAALAREAGLGRLSLRGGSFAAEFPEYPPNALQSSVAADLPGLVTGPGLLLVMAPMGMGKTETALHAARLMGDAAGTSGVFVTLPTMATSDQMYRRVRAYAQRRRAPDVDVAVTLLHSMSWLNAAYQDTADGLDVDRGPVLTGGGQVQAHAAGEDNAGAQTAATVWLRGRKRGLLAPMAVGTVDQALLTVLPVRHNVLRMLGLAGKVLVVDEVHAYDAYMQYLLARLLTWLGALRVPVVLLSATLPGQVAARLVRAYLTGAGGKAYRGQVEVAYPGWVYADAASAVITTRPFEVASRTLAVDLVDVPTVSEDVSAPADRPAADVGLPVKDGADRAAVVKAELAPLLRESGCAMVVCTTVAEAQQTFVTLREWCSKAASSAGEPRVMLLHARMPARQREALTEEVTRAFGREVTHRPRRPTILVATQVAEQSLDLDLDLVVSDLAPIAQLLQRAGRCQRHQQVDDEDLRPQWARRNPRLVVLVPRGPDGTLELPKRWTAVYDASLLRRTYELLADRHPQPVEIPADVQPMVEQVYDETFHEDLSDDEITRFANDEAAFGIAATVAIKNPRKVLDLSELTKTEIDEDLVSTRLGAESVRVVCCYVDDDGTRWLDRARTSRLPVTGYGPKRRFTSAQVKAVLSESLPLRDGAWRRRDRNTTAPPAAWADNPHLRDVLVLPHRLDPDGTVHPVTVDKRMFYLDEALGLTG
ncbi:CRISPR-associated endonuclease Cas3'' [Frankia sp. CcI49]|uniref:CRISPR-associated endonuclease/helicase Cas3 n=2 Tax=Frankiaceae TaxID=74712 RepID=A0A0S4QLV2_9ACTN|nr:CRISPR-associated endonuclease Cas3'' [Frankia sp. CcI49]CUU56577.1 CRISPR-associated endonuclease/helicase Cas3 [Parafrankia irregularis]